MTPLPFSNFNLNFKFMKTVTMVEFRQNAEGVLRRVARGERLVLSHRGKPAARIEPLSPSEVPISPDDPALNLATFAVPGPGGPLSNEEIDRLLYGGA